MIPRRLKKDSLILFGIILMLWGYWQLFEAPPEPDSLNMQVTALTPEETKISGTATGASGETLALSLNGKALTVLKKQIIQLNGVSLDEQEANRALRAVVATIFGGFVVWIAVFVL